MSGKKNNSLFLHIKELITQIDRNHPVAMSRLSALSFVYYGC